MKKVLCIIIVVVLFPISVLAANQVRIEGAELGGYAKTLTVGDEVDLTFSLSFSGLEKKADATTGIVMVIYDIIFDDNTLAPIEVNAEGYDTVFVKVDNEYGALSTISEEAEGNCVENTLQCGDYQSKLKFIIKNTSAIQAKVKIGDAIIFVYDQETDEIIQLEKSINKSYTIDIRQSSKEVIVPEIEIITTLPDVTTKKPSKKPTSDITSVNNNLKSLSVEGYEIEFDKNRKQYDIYIEEGINELKVTAETENEKATYKVIGADDLKANDYKVIIEVTAENKDIAKYTLNVKSKNELPTKEEKKGQKTKKNLLQTVKEKIKNIKKETLIYGAIMFGCIVLLIIVVIINKIVKNHKMNKLLDKF